MKNYQPGNPVIANGGTNGSNGSGSTITLRDLISLRNAYAPHIEVGRNGDQWIVAGERYGTAEVACAAIRSA